MITRLRVQIWRSSTDKANLYATIDLPLIRTIHPLVHPHRHRRHSQHQCQLCVAVIITAGSKSLPTRSIAGAGIGDVELGRRLFVSCS